MADQSAREDRTVPRRRGRPGHDRAAVLRRAAELFNSQGYDATSIDAIARSLGLTKSAIYHHVATKEDLLAEALGEALDGLTAALDAVEADEGRTDPRGRLEATIRQSVLILDAHLPAVTLLLRVRGNSAVEQAALERRRVIDDRFAKIVHAAIDDGAIRDDLPPELTSRLVFGLVNSLVDWYRPSGPLGVDALADAVTGLVLGGLVPRTSS